MFIYFGRIELIMCRDEGLLWVVKILMKEGENITYDDFPEFLDHTSKTHIMQVTLYITKNLFVIEKQTSEQVNRV